MKRTASRTLALSLTALAVVAFAAVLMGADIPANRTPTRAAAPVKPAPSPVAVSKAGVMLRVMYDGESLPSGSSTLTYLARSHGVLETAVAETIKEPPHYRLDIRIMEQRHHGSAYTLMCQVDLTLEAEGAEAQARKALAAVIVRLRDALAKAAKQQQEILRKELAAVSKEVDLARVNMTRLQEHRASLAKEAGMPDPDRNRILSRTKSLESKRESLAVDVAGLRVRIKATQEQVAKLAAKASRAAKDDPVAAELTKVVEYKERKLRRHEEAHAQGKATKAEVMEAAARLAEAKARLAERRQQAATAAAGQLLAELNTQLVRDSIALVEKEAELKAVAEQIKPLQAPALLLMADQYATVDYDLRLARERYSRALNRRASLQADLAATRAPTVIVIGG